MKKHKQQHIDNTNNFTEDEEIHEWYQMRWWMTLIATCQGCLILFEYGASQTSGLYYFKEEFTVGNPKLFYSLSIGINFISGKISLKTIERPNSCPSRQLLWIV